MSFTSGSGHYPKLLGIMLALSMMGCSGGPQLSNPFYKYYEKASAMDNFDDRDLFLKSLSDVEICEVVVLSRKTPKLYLHAARVAELKGKHGLYGAAGCI
ncbi:MAG: hypothetical protein ACPH50_02570 [Candidatus Puniceispirillaceae bacterium]